MIPFDFVRNGGLKKLTPAEVVVLVVLDAHANKRTGKCFPSRDTIQRLSGIKSKDTVRKALRGLESKSIINIVDKGAGFEGKYKTRYEYYITSLLKHKRPVEKRAKN